MQRQHWFRDTGVLLLYENAAPAACSPSCQLCGGTFPVAAQSQSPPPPRPICLQAARLTYDSPATLQGCSHLRTLRSLSLDGLFPSEGGSRAGGMHALLGQALGLTELRLNHVLTDEEDGGFWELHHALLHHTAL